MSDPIIYNYTLPDWAALVAALDRPESDYDRRKGRESIDMKPSWSWDMSAGWAGARRMAGAAGWPEGAEKIRHYTDRWVPRLASMVSLPTYSPDLTGEFFDVGVLMSGEPEHWYQREESPATITAAGRIYKVVINLAASANVRSETLVRRGAAVAAVVAALEATGAAVAVEATDRATRYHGQRQHTSDICVALKAPGEALDLDRLALVAVHPAGLRRLWFRLAEALLTDAARDALDVSREGGYGRPVDRDDADRGDVYSPALIGGDGEFGSDASAEAWAMAQLRALGAI